MIHRSGSEPMKTQIKPVLKNQTINFKKFIQEVMKCAASNRADRKELPGAVHDERLL